MLSAVIRALSKEELRHLKLLLNAFKGTGERLDIKLVDVLRRDSKREESFIAKHYGSNKNAYYRLKNRVSEQVFKTLLHLNYKVDTHHEVSNSLLLARLFNQKEEYALCNSFLKKAEAKAENLDNLDYLNIIYNEFIELSYRYDGVQPEVVIEKQRRLAEKQQKMTEIKQVLAVVNHRLKSTQNISAAAKSAQVWLKEIIERYSEDEDVQNSYQLKQGLYQLVTQSLLQKKDFKALARYVQQNYREFTELGFFDKNNHGNKLQMLTYIINAHLALGNYEKAKNEAEQLYDEMLRFNKLFYHKYLFFYYQTLVVVFSKSRPDKAIKILEEIKSDKELVSNPYYTQFIYLNLSVLYYEKAELNKALEQIVALKDRAIFKKLEESLQLRIDLFELVIFFEMEAFEKTKQLCKAFKSRYGTTATSPIVKLIYVIERVSSYERFQVSSKDKEDAMDILKKMGLSEDRSDVFFSLKLFYERNFS